MSGMDGAFVARVAIASGLAALAFVLLRDELAAGHAGETGRRRRDRRAGAGRGHRARADHRGR